LERRAASDKKSVKNDLLRQRIHALAQFRYALRRFLRFSEDAARTYGITSQQHQLLLGVAGYTGEGTATVSQLADFLQETHHSVVGLVDRAVQKGIVRREQSEVDRRVVVISLTASGEEILNELSTLHEDQAKAVAKMIPLLLKHGNSSNIS